MRIATWNVNSIRTRVGRVVDWLVPRRRRRARACRRSSASRRAVPARGVRGGRLRGRRCTASTSGTASRSRAACRSTDVEIGFHGQPGFRKGARGAGPAARGARARRDGRRHPRSGASTCPNGRALDDPHYAYKLDWLAALARRRAAWLAANPELPLALMGDFNVAPTRRRRRRPELRPGLSTHVSPPERAAFASLRAAGLTDVVRPLVPEGYTYWDYKQLRFPRNEGMRIDFILGIAGVRRPGHGRARSTARSARATPRATTFRCSSTSTSTTEDDDDRPMIF